MKPVSLGDTFMQKQYSKVADGQGTWAAAVGLKHSQKGLWMWRVCGEQQITNNLLNVEAALNLAIRARS